MKFEDIYDYFRSPPPLHLSKEVAVCYVLSVLLNNDSYGTELMTQLEQDYPSYRLSDTVLYSVLKFLEEEATIDTYWKKMDGRGRPRRMYQLSPDWRRRAQDLAQLWHEYVAQTPIPVRSLSHRN